MTRDGMSALQGKVLDLLAVADLDAEGTHAAAGRRRGILDRMAPLRPTLAVRLPGGFYDFDQRY